MPMDFGRLAVFEGLKGRHLRIGPQHSARLQCDLSKHM